MIFLRWSQDRLVRRVSALLDGPPPAGLRAAIIETAAVLTPKVLGARFRSCRDELILIFARQLADANVRLSSSHWTLIAATTSVVTSCGPGRARWRRSGGSPRSGRRRGIRSAPF